MEQDNRNAANMLAKTFVEELVRNRLALEELCKLVAEQTGIMKEAINSLNAVNNNITAFYATMVDVAQNQGLGIDEVECIAHIAAALLKRRHN